MAATENGLAVSADHFEQKIRSFTMLSHPGMPKLGFKQFPLIDSSQMSLEYWNDLAREIYQQYEKYDGFVILHGTDTMAYTGSALSFMLQHLAKPIILTGAQTPLEDVVNDARENITNAIYMAGNIPSLSMVCIYFNQRLLQADRAFKFSTEDYEAFQSPNFPALGSVGSKIEIHPDCLVPAEAREEDLLFTEFQPVDIRLIRITPYLNASYLANTLMGAQAVILESLGDGNVPIKKKFLELLSEAAEEGTVLINRSQCPRSRTCSTLYSVGVTLEAHCDIVSAGDQTIEVIMAKLTYLFNIGLNREQIKEGIKRDFHGELTSPSQSQFNSRINFFPKHSVQHGNSLYQEEKHASESSIALRAKL